MNSIDLTYGWALPGLIFIQLKYFIILVWGNIRQIFLSSFVWLGSYQIPEHYHAHLCNFWLDLCALCGVIVGRTRASVCVCVWDLFIFLIIIFCTFCFTHCQCDSELFWKPCSRPGDGPQGCWSCQQPGNQQQDFKFKELGQQGRQEREEQGDYKFITNSRFRASLQLLQMINVHVITASMLILYIYIFLMPLRCENNTGNANCSDCFPCLKVLVSDDAKMQLCNIRYVGR